ncbi:MAG: glycosyl hydrolase [Eubacterium sp.]|nr:glycosyl hydrolase [Eubacterium sp.]
MKYGNIIEKMKLEDKIKLCSGADYWTTQAFPEYGIPSIRVNDGPHGLRIQLDKSDNLGINKSIPSTCFPAACTTSASWDRQLLGKMGEALAEEAIQEGTAVLLGPGVNIKRNPLCGRNFEYFSEDPYLAGELGAAWISGIQSRGVGASLKHYAGNSQENHRLCSDSIMDERALREIYLAAFEKAVKVARPATVMCAYNLLNGTYCSDNKYLLTDILREEWGFEGAVMSDWGATNHRAEAFKAGMELEMPGSRGYFDKAVLNAVRSGKLAEEYIDICVDRLLALIFTYSESLKQKAGFRYDVELHHRLAREIASQSAVLLKNEKNILPLDKSKSIAIIGELAVNLRYQGTGSSKITPHRISNVLEGFEEHGFSYTYFKGYSEIGHKKSYGKSELKLLEEAVKGAGQSHYAIVVVGLTEDFESEGFDRTNMELPPAHTRLINAIADINENVIVVLFGGSPVTMPWIDRVKGLVNMYLPGQAGGLAAADVLTGSVNPSGKLAETYPVKYEDVICSDSYGLNPKQVLYRESIYVGYRYYDKAEREVLFPFGFGLSYTAFEYSDLRIGGDVAEDILVSLRIKNAGCVSGAEIVQLYVGKPENGVFSPEKELKCFDKVFLQPGEEKEVNFRLNSRAFSYYDTEKKEWLIQKGQYSILAGASSRDIRLKDMVILDGIEKTKKTAVPEWYLNPSGKPSCQEFEVLLGRKVQPLIKKTKGNYDLTCTITDMLESRFVRLVHKIVELVMGWKCRGIDYSNPKFKMMMESAVSTPVKNLILLGDGMLTPGMANGFILAVNGHLLKGMLTILKNEENKSF